MEYSKEFLSQFKIDATNYTYVSVDNQPHVVHLYEHSNVQQYNVI